MDWGFPPEIGGTEPMVLRALTIEEGEYADTWLSMADLRAYLAMLIETRPDAAPWIQRLGDVLISAAVKREVVRGFAPG
jgi:hypothetical protein